MYNIAIALAAGLVIFIAFAFWLGPWAAILPGLLVVVVAFFVLARRSMSQLQLIMEESNKAIQGGKVDRSIEILKAGLPLAKWQILVESQLSGRIGSLIYIKKDFDKALPWLKKAYAKDWGAQCMLGACLYRRKQYDEMSEVMDKACKANKKTAFVWAMNGYLLEKTGKRNEALAKLGEGTEHCPNDEDLKANLLQLQNGKRMKMKRFGDMWYQFFLEPLPAKFSRPRHGFRR